MSLGRPPLPRRDDVLNEWELARYVRSEDELDEVLSSVERMSLPPEMPVDPRMFEPPSFEDESDRLDLNSVVERLSMAPKPAGLLYARRGADLDLAGRRVDLDAVMERISMLPSLNLTPSERPTAPVPTSSPYPSWPRLAMISSGAFMLGSALTYLAG